MMVNNFDLIFMFMAYGVLISTAIQNYGIHTMELFDLTIFVWVILSLIISSDQSILLRDFAVNLVFPIFILGVVFERYGQKNSFASFIFYPIRKYLYERNHNFTPVELYSYFRSHLIAFVPIFFYSVVQTVRNKKDGAGDKKEFLGRVGLVDFDNKKGQVGFLALGVKLIGQMIVSISRYISIVVGIVASLITVSVPNTVMLVISLFMLGTKKYDKRLWTYYMYYSIAIITMMLVHHKIPSSIESFNIELLAILGLIKDTKLCRPSLP
jgi:hypothetical protein